MMRLRWWIRRVDRDGSRGQYPRIGWIEFQLHLLNDGVVHSVCMCESIMVHDDGARDRGVDTYLLEGGPTREIMQLKHNK